MPAHESRGNGNGNGNKGSTCGIRVVVRTRSYAFDAALNEHATQDDVLSAVQIENVVSSVVEGYHATIFCYGQTGSGKTFTMEGARGAVERLADGSFAGGGGGGGGEGEGAAKLAPSDANELGIMPRAVLRLFEIMRETEAARPGERFEVVVDYVQIYRERCYDLLTAGAGGGAAAGAGATTNTSAGRTAVASSGAAPRPMSARHGSAGHGVPAISTVGGVADLRMRWRRNAEFYLEGLTQVQCVDAAAAVRLMRIGSRSKVMAEHRRNANSSRSHCLFTCHVTRRTPDADVASQAKLTLVDLAGSERSSHTGSGGDALLHSEGVAINQSLLALRKVITMLADNARSAGGKPANAHLPYRDSRLTSLLKQSLGGNAFACMVACLSPGVTYAEENASTLEYAARAMLVTNAPVINEDPKARLIRELRAEVARLKNELAQLKIVGVVGSGDEGATSADAKSENDKRDARKVEEENAVAALVADAKRAVLGSAAPASAPAGSDVGGESHSQSALQSTENNELAARALEQLGDRLVHSVRVIRELGDSNGRLRAEMVPLSERLDDLETAHETALDENARLREKLAVCEMVLEGTFHTAQAGMAGSTAEAAAAAASSARLDQEAMKELLVLRRENEALKQRVTDLRAATAAASTAQSRTTPMRRTAAPSRGASSARQTLRAAQTAAMTAAELKSLLQTPTSSLSGASTISARRSARNGGYDNAPAPAPPPSSSFAALRVTTGGSVLPHATLPRRPATAGGVRPAEAEEADADNAEGGGDAAAMLARIVQARSRLRGQTPRG
ncbi:hypothetical protein PPROV_000764800 [Pycnococcus provasolii]|uniref:Kinesin-like protein n=1 Tax=Pycnococcus provasolii TaxID=41880 RepID=A0A830HTT9_9CHLO|nr:hypothetical protein PPROV_000764800 [Pycnococcus provasolii]